MSTGRPTPSWNGAAPAAVDPTKLRLHEHAAVVPAMAADELHALREDIRQRGILDPLHLTSDGVVLDGRARLHAARELGLKTVPAQTIDPADEVEHMLLSALRRRDLTQSQKAALTLTLHDHQQLRTEGRKHSERNLRQNSNTDVAGLPHRGRTRDLLANKAVELPRFG